MKNLIIVLLGLSITGCGPDLNIGYHVTDSKLQPYVDIYVEYKEEYLGYGETHRDITIKFGKLEQIKLGICRHNGDETKEIIINTIHWDRLSEVKKEQLMIHELMHCDGNLRHTNGGIMNAIQISEKEYVDNLDILLQNEFNKY